MKTTLSFLCDILLQEQIVNDAQRHGAGSIIGLWSLSLPEKMARSAARYKNPGNEPISAKYIAAQRTVSYSI